MGRDKNGRWNWYGEGEEDSNENSCYQGRFWDMDTREFLRWNALKQEGKSTERKSTK